MDALFAAGRNGASALRLILAAGFYGDGGAAAGEPGQSGAGDGEAGALPAFSNSRPARIVFSISADSSR
jgi:hypothetical protein